MIFLGVYVNSLALQAVLEQWSSTGSAVTSGPDGSNVGTPSALLPSSLVALYKRNEQYIKEVIEASRNILRIVVEDLLPNDYLKHGPVRMHFRILSGAMFLLKVWPAFHVSLSAC